MFEMGWRLRDKGEAGVMAGACTSIETDVFDKSCSVCSNGVGHDTCCANDVAAMPCKLPPRSCTRTRHA